MNQDSEFSLPAAKWCQEFISAPRKVRGPAGCTWMPLSQQAAQLLDINTTPAGLFGSHPPRNTLNYSSYSMKQTEKKKVKSSWNISIYGSLNPQSFPKKRSERRNVAFVCRLTGTHASLSNSLTELRAEQAPGNADCYGGEKSKELQFQSPLHFRSVPLVCDTCLQVKTKEK